MPKQRIRLEISYDGINYNGWQKQPDGNTIQDHLERALGRIFNQEIRTIGSGRTDSQVHALAQNVHFDFSGELRSRDLAHSINSLLPADIVVQKAWRTDESFHALKSATQKTYRYKILQLERPCPMRRNQSWWLRKELDLERLNHLSQSLVGVHDFQAFQSTGTELATTVRTIYSAQWNRSGEELIFEIMGSGFLKQMVRNIVGTVVVLAAETKADISVASKKLQTILDKKDRTLAAAPAPGYGLYLTKVTYPESMLSSCLEL